MNFNFGLCSISFRKNTPEEILQAMKEAELSVIEWGSDVHVPPAKAEEIALLQQQFGVECCSYGTYFKLGVSSLSELEDYISAAKILGTDVLRLWCGSKNSEDYSVLEKQALFSECSLAAKIAEENGVTLCMECHSGTFTNRKEAAIELMLAVNSPRFRMYWQPRQDRSLNENIEYAILISPFVQNIHVFNWHGSERLPLRLAVSDWQKYLACFRSDKTLLLEFMPDDKIETLPQELAALKEIIA